jgi:hypothetical protein
LSDSRRGIALLMVLFVSVSLLMLGLLFAGSVSAEYRAAVYYRRASEAEAYCLAGIHRAMAELAYDVWGVDESQPFQSARYNPEAGGPEDNLLALAGAAYYESSEGHLRPLIRQRGFWNGEAWVVWAGDKLEAIDSTANPWNMDPRPKTRPELPGGAQRYLSYGQARGRVNCIPGSTLVQAEGGATFNPDWPSGLELTINGRICYLDEVINADQLMISAPWDESESRDLSWQVSGLGDCPQSADQPPTFPGGCQPLSEFLGTGAGYSADPRWIDPARAIPGQPEGGVDLDGDGQVSSRDKALRDWALWQLRCDAFLPEDLDNYDMFQEQLHANDADTDPAARTGTAPPEYLNSRIIGDSYYLIFRSDPVYGASPELCDRTGYRYPYDRQHLGTYVHGTAPATTDNQGGLININGCNNDFGTMLQTGMLEENTPLAAMPLRHRREAKWIYCYDPRDPRRVTGRYAVTVKPQCGTWNVAALHCGNAQIAEPEYGDYSSTGNIAATSGFLGLLRKGHQPTTGEPAGAVLLGAHSCSAAPVRPSPLPFHRGLNLLPSGRDRRLRRRSRRPSTGRLQPGSGDPG